MELIEKTLTDALLIRPKIHADHRGFFFESYSKSKLQSIGLIADFIQDNHSYSNQKGTLRGLHFQIGNKAQAKLIRCIKGRIWDVIIDLRKNSPSYMKSYAVELNEKNQYMLFIPKGLAHGFLCLENHCHISYKVDEYYAPDHQGGVIFNDPSLNINWPIESSKIILSDQDKNFGQFDPLKHTF